MWAGGQVCDIPISRPGLQAGEAGLWGLRPHLWYHPADVAAAWGLLLTAAEQLGGGRPFRFDLADVGRQVPLPPFQPCPLTMSRQLGTT